MVWFLFTLCLMRLSLKYQVRNLSYFNQFLLEFRVCVSKKVSRLIANHYYAFEVLSHGMTP